MSIKVERLGARYMKLTLGGDRYFCVAVKDDAECDVVEYILEEALAKEDIIQVHPERSKQGKATGAQWLDEDDETAPPDMPLRASVQAPVASSGAQASVDTPAEAGAPPEATPPPPACPSGPWEGMTDKQFAFRELTGWYTKGGVLLAGQGPYATIDVLVAGSEGLSTGDKVALFSKISTAKWIQIKSYIAPGLPPEAFKAIDNGHLNFGKVTNGGLFSSLPTADPRLAAHVQTNVTLPGAKKTENLTPHAVVRLIPEAII